MFINNEEYTYTPHFCEENIWWLAKKLLDTAAANERMYVVFFSNAAESVVLYKQRLAPAGGFIVWDYHVVLQTNQQETDWIYDFDTRLSFPAPLITYLFQTFPQHTVLPEAYRTHIRRIPALEYLRHFYSDRTHMVGHIQPLQFPDYPAITPDPSVQPIPLCDYRNMDKQLDDNSLVFDLERYRASLPNTYPQS